MESNPFPLDEYLERIGLEGAGAASLDRLEAAQRAQSRTIPFENFDIVLGRGVTLDPDHLVDKLVRSRRGGYCFELNGLFLRALRAMGFEARALLGRVHVGGEPTGRSHQLSLVEIGGAPFVADVGVGAMTPRKPMPLEVDLESDHDGVAYRLVHHELGYMLQFTQEGSWRDLYSFDLCPVIQADIDYGNHYTATHPSSFFTRFRIASIARPDGRASLFDRQYTCESTEGNLEEEFPDDERYLGLLEERFGIELDARYGELAPLGG